MDYFRPHHNPQPTFEGYYSNFTLPSGARLILIICSVPKASHNPHMVSFTYYPADFPKTPYFQKEQWVDDIIMENFDPKSQPSSSIKSKTNDDHDTSELTSAPVAFELRVPHIGHMRVHTDSTTTYSISDASGSFKFTASVPGSSTRVPWLRNSSSSTPEGLLALLPLPLHWHVHTLSSTCTYHLDIDASIYTHQHTLDKYNSALSSSPTALVHQEKNWAHSFPQSHIWIQARDPSSHSGLCVAGGAILGTQAYLISYHALNPQYDVNFTPPYAMAPSFARALSPTMSMSVSWPTRTVKLSVASVTRKIEIEAEAPQGSFVGISAPFFDGHRRNFVSQSFRATVRVRVFGATRFGFGHWVLWEERMFKGAGLEFGGESYPEAGGERWVN